MVFMKHLEHFFFISNVYYIALRYGNLVYMTTLVARVCNQDSVDRDCVVQSISASFARFEASKLFCCAVVMLVCWPTESSREIYRSQFRAACVCECALSCAL